MIKVKDGYAKLINTSYTGDISLVLLSNGGTIGYDISTNTILATIGSNVASADKLKNKVNLWGLDFDGTTDVNGSIVMTNDSSIAIKTTAGTAISLLHFPASHNFHLGYGAASNGFNTYIDGKNIYLRYGTSHTTGLLLNNSGNITIGSSDLALTNYKLYVNGKVNITGLTTIGAPLSSVGNYTKYNSDKSYRLMLTHNENGAMVYNIANDANSYGDLGFGLSTGKRLYIKGDTGYVGIGTNSPLAKLHVEGNILATGGFFKLGSSDDYVLLGGGGHKLLSELGISGGPYLPLTGGTLTGNLIINDALFRIKTTTNTLLDLVLGILAEGYGVIQFQTNDNSVGGLSINNITGGDIRMLTKLGGSISLACLDQANDDSVGAWFHNPTKTVVIGHFTGSSMRNIIGTKYYGVELTGGVLAITSREASYKDTQGAIFDYDKANNTLHLNKVYYNTTLESPDKTTIILNVDGDIRTTGTVIANKFVSGNGVNDFSAGTVKLDVLNIPTSSGGTTFGPGSNGQVLKSNGTTVYWASDSNSNTWRPVSVNGTSVATSTTGTGTLNIVLGTGITVSGAVNSLTITNAGVRSVTIGTGDNANRVAVNTNGTTAYLVIPYATTASLLNNTSITNPDSAVSGQYLKWYSQINRSDSNPYYAGTNKGFPVSNNANGILWLGTHSGPYGGLLGVSSNTRLYYRFITNNTFPTTANGDSWSKIAWTSDIPTKTSQLTNDSGFLTAHLSLANYVTINTKQTITGEKTFSGTSALLLTIDRNNSNPAWIRFMKNGTLLGYLGVSNDNKALFNNGSNAYDILHSGNSYIKNGVITINGTSITPLTTHQSLANYVTLDGTLTISGTKTFTKDITLYTSSTGDSPKLIFLRSGLNLTSLIDWCIYDTTGDLSFRKAAGNGWEEVFRINYDTNNSTIVGNSLAAGFVKSGSSDSYALLGGGGHKAIGNATGNIPLSNGTVSTNLNADMLDGLHIHTGRNNEVNKVVRTDASGYILAGWINTTSGDMGTTAATRIYCSNDGYIRYKTPANFFETLVNDGDQISITVGSQNRKLTVNYASFTKTLDNVGLPSSTSNAANTAWCKFARITFNNAAWSTASGYLFFGGGENPDNRGILVYHFRASSTATTLSTANLHWLVKSYNNATVIAVKAADNVYDLYTNNSGTYECPRIYHMSAFSGRFAWSVGSWTTTKPTAAYTSSDIGRVYYAENANSATQVIVNLHTSNNTEYPLVWSNSASTSTTTGNLLYKSYSHLTYNPSAHRISTGQYIANNSSGPHFTANSTAGNWAYLRLHNGSTYWDIATRSTSGSGGLWLARLSGADNGIFVSTGNSVGISTSSPSYKLHVAGDAYATGWSRAGNGFYVEGKGVYYMSNNANGLGQIYLTSNEFNWSASGAALYFNYRASANGTTVTLYIWNAGSSSTYASHTLGALTSRGDLSLYGLTQTCNKANDAGYMNSALQIREYNFGGSQSATWAIAPRLSWHWSGRVLTLIGLASGGDLYLSKNNFTNAYLLLHLGNSSISDYNVKIGDTTKLFVRDWGHGAANMNAVARGGRSSMGMADLSTPSGGTATAVNPNGQTNWHHFINISYTDGGAGSNSWVTLIANKAGTTDLWVRSRSGGTISDTANWTAGWTRILTGTNYTSVLDGRYYTESEADGRFVNVTGDTMTGPLTFANGTWNVVGDDAAIGDYNAAGMLGLKSINNNIPGIGFHNSSNTLLGRLQASGSTLLWNDYTVVNSSNWPSYIGGDGYVMRGYTIDATGLDLNTWYPVTMYIGARSNVRIEIRVSLDSGSKPSWSTHTSGFSVRKIWEVNGSGWGTNTVHRTVFVSDYAHASADPVRGMGDLGYSSTEYVYVRGGGKYYFYTSHNVAPYLRTSTYVGTADPHYQAVSPTTTAPGTIAGFLINRNMYASHFYENSDATLKTNIETINTSDNIPQLKSFTWKEDGKHSYGLIALELEEMGYTELVEESNGKKTVQYSAALSLIVGKLQVKIKELEKEIEELKNK